MTFGAARVGLCGPGPFGAGLGVLLAVLSALPSSIVLRAQAAPVFFLENWEAGLGASFNSRNYGNTSGSQFLLQQAVRSSTASRSNTKPRSNASRASAAQLRRPGPRVADDASARGRRRIDNLHNASRDC